MSRNIHVSNLALQATAADLREAFGAYGTVTRIHIVSDCADGRRRAYGYVEMADGGERAANPITCSRVRMFGASRNTGSSISWGFPSRRR